jgi:uncharacterized FlaG/YvyC family protein
MISKISSIAYSSSSNSTGSASSSKDRKELSDALKSGDINFINNADNYSKTNRNPNAANSVTTNKSNDLSSNFDKIAGKIKDIIDDDSIDVKFDQDKDTKKYILKIIDKKTNDTIRQYPPEITLKVAKMVTEITEHGAITDAKA